MIKQNLSTEDVRILKLTSGETIFGKHVVEDDGYHYVVHPVLLYLKEDMTPGFAPFTPFTAKQHVFLKDMHVMTCDVASPGLKQYYIKMTTGIQTATENDLQELKNADAGGTARGSILLD